MENLGEILGSFVTLAPSKTLQVRLVEWWIHYWQPAPAHDHDT